MIRYRKATLDDLKKIVKLSLEEEKYFRRKQKEDIYTLKSKKEHEKVARDFIKKRNRILLIAEKDGKIIGYLYGIIWINSNQKINKKGVLNEIFITEKYRKKGIASRLKDEFFKWLKKNKINYVLLYVEKDNKTAQKVYKKWGFKEHYLEFLKKLK